MAHQENEQLSAMIEHFKETYPELADLLIYCPRAKRVAGNKGTFGAPDLILLYPTGGYSSLCVQVLNFSERVSEQQKRWRAVAEHVGCKCIALRTLVDFADVVERYLINSPYA